MPDGQKVKPPKEFWDWLNKTYGWFQGEGLRGSAASFPFQGQPDISVSDPLYQQYQHWQQYVATQPGGQEVTAESILRGLGDEGETEITSPEQYQKELANFVTDLVKAGLPIEQGQELLSVSQQAITQGVELEQLPLFGILTDITPLGRAQRDLQVGAIKEQFTQYRADLQVYEKSLSAQQAAGAKQESERVQAAEFNRVRGSLQKTEALLRQPTEELPQLPSGDRALDEALGDVSPAQRRLFTPVLQRELASIQGLRQEWQKTLRDAMSPVEVLRGLEAKRDLTERRAQRLAQQFPDLYEGFREPETTYESTLSALTGAQVRGTKERLVEEQKAAIEAGTAEERPARGGTDPWIQFLQDFDVREKWLAIGSPYRRGERPSIFRPSARRI